MWSNQVMNEPFESIHLRLQPGKRGRKLTLVEGLSENVCETISKPLKKKLGTGVTIAYSDEEKPVLHVQGDHRYAVAEYIVNGEYALEDNITIHGI